MNKNVFKQAVETLVAGAVALGYAECGMTPEDIAQTLYEVKEDVLAQSSSDYSKEKVANG